MRYIELVISQGSLGNNSSEENEKYRLDLEELIKDNYPECEVSVIITSKETNIYFTTNYNNYIRLEKHIKRLEQQAWNNSICNKQRGIK